MYYSTLCKRFIVSFTPPLMQPIHVNNKSVAEEIVNNYDNFLFDCDGVVWLDEHAIPGFLETLEYLESKGKRYAFVTNNSSKSRDDYLQKFERLGFKGVSKDQIFPTCYAAARHIRDHLKIEKGSKIWVMGDSGIEEELKEQGYIPLGGCDERLNTSFDSSHELLKVDAEVKAVVVGSTKDFNYMRIASTLQYLLYENKRIPFVGCNIDRTYPGPGGMILPAGGSVVAYMSYTAHRDNDDVGKPSSIFLDTVLEQTGFDKDRTLMVGDTLYTDIKFGNDGNLGSGKGSLLVLSGGTKRYDLEKLLSTPKEEIESSMVPSYVAESFGSLIEFFK